MVILKYLKKYSFYLIMIAVVLVYLNCFCTAVVNGDSMLPTLTNEDFLMMRQTHSVKTGDIIAVYSKELDKNICKRVIGIPNDEVIITEGRVHLNGVVLDEPYIVESWITEDSCIVPEGHIYILGDNRNNSLDSRMLGCLPMDDIQGVLLVNMTELIGLNRKGCIIVGILFWILFLSSSFFLQMILGKDKV